MCVMDDEGRALGVDERGEICVRGDTVMGGYLDGTPEGVLVTSEGKTWLYTGDCGYVDADGYYHFVGRKKRMSIIAGINVYHQEVEQLAYEVEGVACAAVTEIRLKGKVAVKLWLVPKEGYGERLREAVLAHLKRRLTKYCVPREVAVIESMPRTPLGKVDYRRLSEDA